MTVWLVEMFGISLILTIIIEMAVTFLMGFSRKKQLMPVALVNVLTNPPAVLCHWLGSMYLQKLPDLWLQIVIEIAVVLTEALIYHSFFRKEQWRIRHRVYTANGPDDIVIVYKNPESPRVVTKL